MRNANVLIVTMRALGNEVAKNLVLAGIGRLTVLDPDDVVEDDLGSQFFITEKHVGMNVYWPTCIAIKPALTDIYSEQKPRSRRCKSSTLASPSSPIPTLSAPKPQSTSNPSTSS
jgi:molybdopterin/thiamine biosynthesis adenylyltransferase